MSWDTDGPIPHRPAMPPNVCADTFPGHDDPAVVVRGLVEGPRGGLVPVELALHPHSAHARIILAAPFSAYRIRDERLPRL